MGLKYLEIALPSKSFGDMFTPLRIHWIDLNQIIKSSNFAKIRHPWLFLKKMQESPICQCCFSWSNQIMFFFFPTVVDQKNFLTFWNVECCRIKKWGHRKIHQQTTNKLSMLNLIILVILTSHELFFSTESSSGCLTRTSAWIGRGRSST